MARRARRRRFACAIVTAAANAAIARHRNRPTARIGWYFCVTHAGEYNRGYNYFEGLSAEEAAEREADETRTAEGYTASKHNSWAGPGDGTRSRDEMRALEMLDLEPDADFEAIRAAWRRLAKANHPDVRPGDPDAAVRFQAVQAAYEVLRAGEEARTWKGLIRRRQA